MKMSCRFKIYKSKDTIISMFLANINTGKDIWSIERISEVSIYKRLSKYITTYRKVGRDIYHESRD